MARAKEVALFGDMWSAEEALAIGLVNRVLPGSEIDAFVDDWARRLADGPPLALSMTKSLLHASSNASMEQAVEDEARCQALNFSSQDTAEAMDAFKEKRAPVFIGR
jgi:2-(1,2-epoxy-1,2-dihydrophenyl)acetyl-CoA isomerase